MNLADKYERQRDLDARFYALLGERDDFNRNDVMRLLHWPHWIADKFLSRLESEEKALRTGTRWKLSPRGREEAAIARDKHARTHAATEKLDVEDRVAYQLVRGRAYHASDLRAMAGVAVDKTEKLIAQLMKKDFIARKKNVKKRAGHSGKEISVDLSDYTLTDAGYVRQLVLKGEA